jgi:outer membrane protein assembly factor BamE (lipoprotein component of BamABCDE complex)
MKKILTVLVLVVLSACTFQTKHRGYVFPSTIDTDITEIKTTAQLRDKIGDPQTKTMYGDEVWIYYGADENYRGPLPHTFTDKTVVLAWVRGNSVQKIQVLHDADLPNVRAAAGETKIPAAIELNALQELFNNVGRFTPAGLGQ